MIKDTITTLIINSITVGDDAQRAKLQAFATAVLNLATAGDNYSDQSEANEGDNDAETKVAERLVELSGTLTDLTNKQKIEQLKAIIADVYADPDKELETRGEALFNSAVDFRLAADGLADLFTVPAPE